jgi:hypothetical protein
MSESKIARFQTLRAEAEDLFAKQTIVAGEKLPLASIKAARSSQSRVVGHFARLRNRRYLMITGRAGSSHRKSDKFAISINDSQTGFESRECTSDARQ